MAKVSNSSRADLLLLFISILEVGVLRHIVSTACFVTKRVKFDALLARFVTPARIVTTY